jgi:DNA-binding beta-propeller fold protein YncE
MNRPHDRSRLRSRTLAILGVLALATTVACSSESTNNDPTTRNPPPDQGGQLGNGKPSKIDPAANGSDFMSPFDATPDLDGKTVYFTGLTREGDPGVFKVDAKGGAITRLFVGEPLSTPFGIAISEDGKTLFIADSGAARSETEEGGNVFTLSIEGGTPSVLSGTEGTRPRGLEVKGEQVYFTGKKDGKAGLFTVGVGGGSASAVAVGAPFADPSGVAIRKNGEVYVADSSPDGEAGSAIIRVADGKAELFQMGIAVGHPAGVALSQDEDALLISGIEPEKGTDIVYRIDLGSKEMTTFDAVIKDFMESAGLHRAKKAEVYAWADSRANKGGTVYVLSN